MAPHVHAPFNFVPLPDKVFFPDWAKQISFDVPFSDGLSGTIDLTIRAETPIFVRNGESSRDQKSDKFSQTPDGRYFIPGTSIKGAIRNVLEILSFGKMRLDKRAAFAQREWNNPKLYEIKSQGAKIKCGYLKRADNHYVIVGHGTPMRISHKELDALLESKVFEKQFCKSKHPSKLQDNEKTAFFKYEKLKIGEKKVEEVLGGIRSFTYNFTNQIGQIVVTQKEGDYRGRIVLTGSPDLWDDSRNATSKGKFYEFVFPENVNGDNFELSAEDFEHFKFIYKTNFEGKKKENSEWGRIEKLLNEETGVPVFYRGDGNKLVDYGMAMLYRLPYKNTPYEILPSEHKKDEIDSFRSDLAECIFGYISKNDEYASLKGRVQFGNAFAKEGAKPIGEQDVTPGSPKASYYPIYIKQNGGDYKTYNDGEISGWKRYILKNGTNNGKLGTDKTSVKFFPLGAGSEFKCRVSFFNLRPVELGALLSAISFHATPGCRHQIGGGKPFGYGKVKIDIDDVSLCGGSELNERLMLGRFEAVMEGFTSGHWRDSETIKELFSMANDTNKVNPSDEEYQYMTLDVKQKVTVDGKALPNNEFELSKRFGKLYLKSFTKVKTNVVTTRPNSLKDIAIKIDGQPYSQKLQEFNNQLATLSVMSEASSADIQEKLRKVAGLCAQLDSLAIEFKAYNLDAEANALKQKTEELSATLEASLKLLDVTALLEDYNHLPESTKEECEHKLKQVDVVVFEIEKIKESITSADDKSKVDNMFSAGNEKVRLMAKINGPVKNGPISDYVKASFSPNVYQNKLVDYVKNNGPLTAEKVDALIADFDVQSNGQKKKYVADFQNLLSGFVGKSDEEIKAKTFKR